MVRLIFLSVGCLVVLSSRVWGQEHVDYARDIKPLLKERCTACHGSLKRKAGLRLDTAAALRKGGESGPAIIAGTSSKSLLVERVSSTEGGKRMPPPSEGEALSPKQIALLKTWIDQGARAFANEKPEEDPRRHWAFRRPIRPPLPPVKSAGWAANPIDAFIAAEHDRHGLEPRGIAAREVLLRRLYLDLMGLPPSREELHDFLNDPASNAYEKVVDRLLTNPHYGERWGRHWMDVWRYSDWYGRRAVPDVWNSAPQIWRWRDWIIRSLNADKGYDRMIQEMLAADEIAPEDDDALVATGYIVRNWYALNPNQWMRDMVEHTGKAFLGLTLNCCHCHDHKYDPLSQEEYFRFRAFFEPIGLRQDRVAGEADPGPFQKYEYSKLRKVVKLGSIRVFDEQQDAKTYMYLQGDERNRVPGKPPVMPAAPAFLGGDNIAIAPVALPARAYYPGLKAHVRDCELKRAQQALAVARRDFETAKDGGRKLAEAHLATAEAGVQSISARLAADEARYANAGNADDLARAASKAERLTALCVAKEKLAQGEQGLATIRAKAPSVSDPKLKEAVRAEQDVAAFRKLVDKAGQALSATSTSYTPFSPLYPKTSTGRRTALAKWIASRDNPLTARVAVNHIWMRHFDRPLVETVFDFGRNGKRPTHPELLDWLAVEFMDSGWSMKHLHRLIVTSRTYRLESTTGGPNQDVDADNRWLWRFPGRRMEAEVVRDSILAAAGELERTVGGPVIENTEAPTSRRRSLYFSVYPEDGGHARILEIFDAPDPCDCYRRTASELPQQALALTNNQLTLNQSRLLARRLSQTAGKNEDESVFIVAGFEQVLCRRPTTKELELCRDFLHRQAEAYRQKSAVPPVPGTVPPSADPAMRARESLVRVLFNHSDFVSIR